MLILLTALYLFAQNLITAVTGLTVFAFSAMAVYWFVMFMVTIHEEGPYIKEDDESHRNVFDGAKFKLHFMKTVKVILIMAGVNLFTPTEKQLDILVGAVVVQYSADALSDFMKTEGATAVTQNSLTMVNSGLSALTRKFDSIANGEPTEKAEVDAEAEPKAESTPAADVKADIQGATEATVATIKAGGEAVAEVAGAVREVRGALAAQ